MSTIPSDIQIIKCADANALQPYITSCALAYREVFSNPPYNEEFQLSEAEAILQHHIQIPEQMTFLAVNKEDVIGFGLACPVQSYPEITRQIRGLLPMKYTYYFVELGVTSAWRRKGIGRHLTEAQLEAIDGDRYQHILLRTSYHQDASYQMYTSMGFEDMGVYSEISARRIDGSIQTDRRQFLSRLIQDQ